MKAQSKISKELKYKDNPRKINEKQKHLLKNHIDELGDLSGVVYCQNHKSYVGGNQRSDIFDGAKIEVVKEYKKPNKFNTVINGFIMYNNERFAYREVKFNENQFKQACIVANNDGGENDWEVLSSNDWNNDDLKNWGLEPINFSNDISDFFDIKNEDESETNNENKSINNEPKMSDDNYSKFEIVMLYENKLILLEELNKTKNKLMLEKNEDALMEIIKKHKTNERK